MEENIEIENHNVKNEDIKDGYSLKKKTVKGLFWVTISQGGKQGIQFIITAILARLISPNDFGLMAMMTVFINFAMIFSEMGISSALIQKQNAQARHYDSAFWLNIGVGIILTLIFIFSAPLIAAFYKKPELKEILSVLSLNFVISSFVVIQQAILMKEMDFKKLAKRDIVAIAVSGGTGIFAALNGCGVWSLVIQQLSFSLTNAMILWVLSSWRPKFRFNVQDVKDILYFSANLTGFQVVNYFARNIDQVLIGRFLGANSLGYYALAYKIMLFPVQNISWIVGKVMFPAFSKMNSDISKIQKAYKNMIKGISMIAFPLMTVLFIVCPEFVDVVFGPQWQTIVPILRIFCLCGMAQSIGTTIGNVLLSQGRADLMLKLQLIGSFIVALSVITGLKWDAIGVAFFYTVQAIVWVPFILYITSKCIHLSGFEWIGELKRPFFICLLLCIILVVARMLIFYSSFYRFLILVVLSLIALFGAYLFLEKASIVKIRNLLQ